MSHNKLMLQFMAVGWKKRRRYNQRKNERS
jgi:hypothetical protein